MKIKYLFTVLLWGIAIASDAYASQRKISIQYINDNIDTIPKDQFMSAGQLRKYVKWEGKNHYFSPFKRKGPVFFLNIPDEKQIYIKKKIYFDHKEYKNHVLFYFNNSDSSNDQDKILTNAIRKKFPKVKYPQGPGCSTYFLASTPVLEDAKRKLIEVMQKCQIKVEEVGKSIPQSKIQDEDDEVVIISISPSNKINQPSTIPLLLGSANPVLFSFDRDKFNGMHHNISNNLFKMKIDYLLNPNENNTNLVTPKRQIDCQSTSSEKRQKNTGNNVEDEDETLEVSN